MTEEVAPEVQELPVDDENVDENALAPEQPEGDGEQAGGEPTEQEPQDEEPPWFKKRFDDITRDKYAWQEQAEYWKQKALEGQQPEPEPEPPPQAPDINGFDDLGEYHKAFADYNRQIIAHEVAQQGQTFIQQQSEQAQTQAQQAEQAQIAQVFAERTQEARKTLPNFDAIALNPTLPVSQPMADEIRVSEKGPELLYHLGQNPDKAARIAAMDATGAARAIGRLEAELSRNKTPTPTNAPPPPKPIQGGVEHAGKDPSKMSTKEYQKWRLSGGGA